MMSGSKVQLFCFSPDPEAHQKHMVFKIHVSATLTEKACKRPRQSTFQNRSRPARKLNQAVQKLGSGWEQSALERLGGSHASLNLILLDVHTFSNDFRVNSWLFPHSHSHPPHFHTHIHALKSTHTHTYTSLHWKRGGWLSRRRQQPRYLTLGT